MSWIGLAVLVVAITNMVVMPFIILDRLRRIARRLDAIEDELAVYAEDDDPDPAKDYPIAKPPADIIAFGRAA